MECMSDATQQPMPATTQYFPDQPSAAPALTQDPGFILAVIGLVSAFFASIVGLVLGIIALQQSKRAGFQNPTAIAAIIVSASMTVITVVIVLFSIVLPVIFGLVIFAIYGTTEALYQGY
mgnify:CR=1 FL=1